MGQGFSFVENYAPKEYKVGGEQIHSITQDSNGVLYFGTGENILMFDGVKWNGFHIGESGWVTIIRTLKNGEIIAGGTKEIGIITQDSINMAVYKSLDSKHDSSSTFWEIHEYRGKTITRNFFGLDTFVEDTLYNILTDSLSKSFLVEDSLLIKQYKGGIIYFDGNSFFPIQGSEVFADYNIDFMSKIDNSLVIGVPDSGFFRQKGTQFELVFTDGSEYIKQYGLYTFLELQDGNFALATNKNGVAIMSPFGEILYILNEENGLQSNQVYALYETEEGILWIGLDKGISRVHYNSAITKVYSEDLKSTSSLDVEIVNGRIWVSTKEGLFSGIKDRFGNVSFVKESEVGSYPIIERKGDILFVSDSEVLYKFEQGKTEPISEGGITSFSKDERGVTINKDQEIFFLDSKLDTIGHISTENYFINSISYNGELFYYTADQIFKIIGEGNEQVLSITSDHPDNRINQLGIINDELYIGLNSGLFKYDPESYSFKKDSIYFKDQKQVFFFEQCKENEVWFNHDKGIKKARLSDGGIEIVSNPYGIIGEEEAVLSVECDEEGVWFAGEEGVYYLADRDWDYKTNFKTNITGIYVNNDSLIHGGFGEPVKDIVLPYEDNELRFTYAAASYIDPERNTYSYKLEGFDQDWSDWSLEAQKDYTNIPEGDYIFKIRSRNVYEVDGREDQISFSVLPPWYRTWWAYVLYLILVTTVFYSIYKVRINQLLKVERMRTKIASDLHDEVSATLTGISYFAEAVRRDKNKAKKEHFISLIRESAGDAKEKITDIVWSINPDNDDWGMFLSKCRRYASDLLESKDIKYELKIADKIPGKLPMEIRQHLWMIYKEMLTNAVRHSNASRLDIIMDVDGRYLKLIVQDDGRGFDSKDQNGGNGVSNIKRRAEAINATLEIDSESGFGTRWRLVLPL